MKYCNKKSYSILHTILYIDDNMYLELTNEDILGDPSTYLRTGC